jgi:hypothetical protein
MILNFNISLTLLPKKGLPFKVAQFNINQIIKRIIRKEMSRRNKT